MATKQFAQLYSAKRTLQAASIQIVINNIQFFGGDSEEATPVPIPNTEVKLFSADGTAREAVWESRTPPKIFQIPGVPGISRGLRVF